MKTTLQILAFLLVAGAAANAQVAPAATGPGGLPISGSLQYSLRFSQTAEFGGSIGNWETSNASASAAYSNGHERFPFILTYSGGYAYTESGPSYSTGLFQNLSLSQGFTWRKLNLTLSDDASYRPQAPTTGFSGIAGIGDIGTGTGSGTTSSQTVLTLKAHALNNIATGQLNYTLTSATSLDLGGSTELLRYVDGNGLDTNTRMANAGVTRRLNARNSLTAKYTFYQFSYPDYGYTITANSGLFGFTREWNRKISTDISVGPQWTRSSGNSVTTSISSVPSSINVATNASLSYKFRFTTANLIYTHGTGSGGGYMFGAEEDSAGLNLSRDFTKNLTIAVDASYRRTAGLQNNESIDGMYSGVQATRRLGRYMSVFASYNAENQSTSQNSSLTSSNPAILNNLLQVVSFGIGYSPRETQLRH
jgi:hypothetical protein